MNIIDNRVKPAKPEITLNDIPLGQVFKGSITGKLSGITTTGVFYKAQGRWYDGDISKTYDVVVVRIDSTIVNSGKGANLWFDSVPVKDYEPLVGDFVIIG